MLSRRDILKTSPIALLGHLTVGAGASAAPQARPQPEEIEPGQVWLCRDPARNDGRVLYWIITIWAPRWKDENYIPVVAIWNDRGSPDVILKTCRERQEFDEYEYLGMIHELLPL